MKITYIHHSSFLAELDQLYLLFDYIGDRSPHFPQIRIFWFW